MRVHAPPRSTPRVRQALPEPASAAGKNSNVAKLAEFAHGTAQRGSNYFGTRLGGMAISAPGDAAEREAQAVASGAAPRFAPRPSAGGPIGAALGPGRPLDASTSAAFGPVLGSHAANVRLHTDARAHRLAGAARANALTDGRSIAFRRGAYMPGSPSGRALLAHELAHVALGHGADGRLHRDDAATVFAETGVVMGAGGAAGDLLLRRYPLLAASLTPAEWTVLASAAGAREGTLAEDAPVPMVTSLSVPLSRLLDPLSRAVDMDVWPSVFSLLQEGGAYGGTAAGLLIRNEILIRFQLENGVYPAEEMVAISVLDPLAIGTGASELSFSYRELQLETQAGAITANILDAAIQGSRLDDIITHVSADAQSVAEAAGLVAQADAFDEKVPTFDARIRGNFRGAVRNEVGNFQAAAGTAQTHSASAGRTGVASGLVSGLDTRYATHAATLATLLSDLDAWRLTNPRETTLSEAAEQNTRRAAELDLPTTFDPFGNLIDPVANAAITEFVINMVGGRTQRDIAEAYDRGEISMADMDDLQYCAAVRTATVVVVGIALTVATAGLGSAVAGGLGLASGGIAAGAVAGGFEGGVVVLGTMGSEHLLTSSRSFDNLHAQEIWGRGAYTPEEYLLGGALGIGGGAAFGAGLAWLGRPGAAGAMPLIESAEHAALRADLRLAFGELDAMTGTADAAKIADALTFIRALPESTDRTLLLRTHEIVARSLASPEEHAAVAMEIVAQAQREGLTLSQLLAQQRQAATELATLGDNFQGLGVGSTDPRAVYSRALIRMAEQDGLEVSVIPRTASYGDAPFFEQVVGRHPTLFDEAIDLTHGWHSHAFQDAVVTRGLRQSGLEMDAYAFRQLFGSIQQAGQSSGRLTGVGAPIARQDQLGQLLWEAYFDTASPGSAAYIGRPEYITAMLRKTLGYID